MLKLSFLGGAQEVTGSNFLLESENSKILIDCGLYQGTKFNEKKNANPFQFDPKSIDSVIVTHGHLDHIGRIPSLVKNGFAGKIFSTFPTRDFAEIMLLDSLGVMKKEAEKHKNGEMMYEEKDVEKVMSNWEGLEYGQEFRPSADGSDFKIKLKDAGHILGSSMIEVEYKNKKIIFTGDLGNPPNPILKDTERVSDANFLIIESIYGDSLHEDAEQAKLKLERVIEDTISRGGVLMIPAFSIERTQKLLFEINDFIEHGRIQRVPIFVDSPLAIKATAIYRKHEKYFNDEAKKIIKSGDDIFNFPGLKMTPTADESKMINDILGPKIIMAGSGMCNGGRIIHHLRRYLPDKKNTILLMGYQATGSVGRQIQEGAKTVNIMGDTVFVNARVENIRGYSAHPDMNELYDFVYHTADTLKKVFVVQGEPKASMFFTQRLRDYMGVDAVVPKEGDIFELEI